MTFAMLSPFFKHITKCCPCHDFWLLLRHVTKCCACHATPTCMSRKCCACHAKTTRWSWHASKVLRLPHKTRKCPPTLRLWRLKTSISCETSSNFHTFETKNRRFYESFSYNKAIFTKLQNYDFLRGFRNFSRQSPNAAPARTFDTVSCSRSPANAIHGKSTLNASQNAAPATQMQNATLQSAAPATQKWHADIDTPLKYCACHSKHENDLPSGDFEAPKRAFRARLPPLFIFWRTWLWRIVCVPPTGEKLTTRRGVDEDPTTTRRRRHDKNDANTGPTPDPNYKREPFATHSGKRWRSQKVWKTSITSVEFDDVLLTKAFEVWPSYPHWPFRQGLNRSSVRLGLGDERVVHRSLKQHNPDRTNQQQQTAPNPGHGISREINGFKWLSVFSDNILTSKVIIWTFVSIK